MSEPTPAIPTRALRLFAGMANWLFGIALGGWLALGLTAGLLHGFIVPRIDQLRPWLEAQASQALGAPVRIGRISAESSGLLPSFALDDITLPGAPGEAPALAIRQLRVSVSALSLWRLGVQRIVIEQPVLRLARTQGGGFALGSLRFGESAPDNAPPPDQPALDWLMSQPELLIEGGRLQLAIARDNSTDAAQVAAAPFALGDLRLVLRNHGRRHAARLDARIDPGDGAATTSNAGQPLSLIAQLRSPLLSVHPGRWHLWDGRVYADLPALELADVARLANSAVAPERGRASLQVWAELDRADWIRASADLRLADLSLRLPQAPAPLALRQLDARLDWQRLDDGGRWQARQLVLVAADGTQWPGRELQFSRQHHAARQQDSGTFSADRLDLAQLTGFARSLPLPADLRATLARFAPKGTVENLNAGWNGAPDAFPPPSYQASGQAHGIEFTAQPAAARAGVRTNPGIPGLRGADATFELNQHGGTLALRVAGGSATFPGIFEDATVPFTSLSAGVHWQRLANGRWEVDAPDLKFSNADAAGSARLHWRSDAAGASKAGAAATGAPPLPSRTAAAPPSPGSIELDGTLDRGNLARLHRYLPLELPAPVRRYLKDALTAGSASAVRFQVAGALRDFPYVDPKRGQFNITAQLRDSTFAFAPVNLLPAHSLPWPPLTQMSGELVLERASLQVHRARGRFGTAPGLPILAANAAIADFDRPLVQVEASSRAPLADLLKTVRTTPIAALLAHALDTASGSGSAPVALKLALPIDQLDRSTVQGSVTFAGNDLRLDADGPRLQAARGELTFTERGFQLAGLHAELFGGPVRIDGGSSTPSPSNPDDPARPLIELQAHGSASAAGLRGAADAGLLAQLAHVLDGAAAYDATLRILRSGPQLVVTSDLRGLAMQLPAPLAKTADTALPMRYENGPLVNRAGSADADPRDRLTLELGDLASARFERTLAAGSARVARGSVTLGLPAAAAPALPPRGVAARVELARFELGRWSDALALVQGSAAPTQRQPGPLPAEPPSGSSPAAAARASVIRSYWPTQWQARIGELLTDSIALHQLSLGGAREGALWRSTAQAEELTGRIEFRESADDGPGRLRARLGRLRLTDPDQAATALAPARRSAAAAERLPALDVVVDRFELHGRDLGRLEIDAVNRPGAAGSAREWRLNRLALSMPEATFSARGNWTQPPAGSSPTANPSAPASAQTTLDFTLDIVDSGRLLERFGMKDVLRQGRGALAGRLGWLGSPLALDYPSLGGQFHLDVAAGQFLKADPGLAKLLGVLSLQALPRRLSLDFRDLFSAGFAFDFVRGDVEVKRGVASTNNLQMKGASAAVLMEGRADIEAETESLRVVVVPEIDAGTAALVATAINPALGLGTFLAQYFLRKPLSRAATQEFQVDGTWSDPRIAKLTGRSTTVNAAVPPEPPTVAIPGLTTDGAATPDPVGTQQAAPMAAGTSR